MPSQEMTSREIASQEITSREMSSQEIPLQEMSSREMTSWGVRHGVRDPRDMVRDPPPPLCRCRHCSTPLYLLYSYSRTFFLKNVFIMIFN